MSFSAVAACLALAPSASAAVDPTYCTGPNGGPSGTPNFLFNDDMENPASGNWALTGEWTQGATPNVTSGSQALIGGTVGQGNPAYAATMTRDITIPNGAFLRFNHDYGFGAGDGGVIEFSVDGGATWNDAQSGGVTLAGLAPGKFTYPPGTLAAPNPLAPRRAFTGDSAGFQTVRIPLDSVRTQPLRLRFLIGTDAATGGDPWFVDDFSIYNCPPTATITGGTPDGKLFQKGTRGYVGPEYTFTSDGEQGRFECQVVPADGHSAPYDSFTPCFSPLTLEDLPSVGINEGGLSEGKFTFQVRAVELVDGSGGLLYSPIVERRFEISFTCVQAEQLLAIAQKKLKQAKDRLKRYKKALAKAEESGEADRIEGAEEKVAQAKKKVKAAKKKVKKKQAVVDRECAGF